MSSPQLSLLWVRTIHSIQSISFSVNFSSAVFFCLVILKWLYIFFYYYYYFTSYFRRSCRVYVRVCVCVPQLCVTLWDPMDCSPPGSSVHGISQARILEWVAIPFSRGSSWPWDQMWVSCIAGRFFTVWATKEASYFRRFCRLCRIWMCLCLWPFLTKLPGMGF